MQTLSQRYRQAHRETRWALGLAAGYFLWWFISAYHFSPTSDSLPTLYLGLPLWFLLACVIGPIVFTIGCGVMVRFVYQDMPLDVVMDDKEASSNE